MHQLRQRRVVVCALRLRTRTLSSKRICAGARPRRCVPFFLRLGVELPWRLAVPFALCSATARHALCSPPGSSVHGLFQAGILKWAAVFYSRGSS